MVWRRIYLISLIFALPLSLYAQSPASPSPDSEPALSIKSGSYFNQCKGYCSLVYTITEDKITALWSSSTPKEEYPDLEGQGAITQKEWESLLALIDLDKFEALPEKIGCPDCYDQGGEWIEISKGQFQKRVDFDPYALLRPRAEFPELSALRRQIREVTYLKCR